MTSLGKNFKPEYQKRFRKCTKAAKALSSRMKKPVTLNKDQKIIDGDEGDDDELHEEEGKKKKSPYSYPKEIDDFSYRTKYKEDHLSARENANLYKYYNRPNYRSRLNEGKSKRLHVSSDLQLPGKSLTENVDSEFFTVVSGRPITEKFKLVSYIKDLQSLFLVRMQIGYKYDETYLIEEMQKEEKKRLEEITKRFEIYSEYYYKFLAEDHSSSLYLLRAADEESKKSKMKREKIRNLLRDCGWYRTKILILDEQWRIARIFQKFLYRISPLWWRKEYDFLHKADTGDILTVESSLFGKQQTSSAITVPSIITIVDQFIEEVGKSEPPQLYFTDPNELLQILQDLEKNNLFALLQCEELTQPAQQMISGLEKAHKLFKQEVDILWEHLKSLEEEVIFEETRSREYEQKAKAISFGLFKDLIVDKYTLNLYVNVEDCFEECVAPNDSNLTLSMMMKGIEFEQESLMVALDKLPNDIVYKALQTCFKEDARIMKEAHEATKIITQIENLMKTLRKSLEPKTELKRGRKLLWRSEPPVEKMERKSRMKSLSKEQLDYLYFFTDFCPGTEGLDLEKLSYSKLPDFQKKEELEIHDKLHTNNNNNNK